MSEDLLTMPRPFSTPSEDALPPEKVRILDLQVEPNPDKKRVKVRLQITPFQQDPSVELSILDQQGNEVSRVFIIETIDDHLLFTMHIRTETQPGDLTLSARLYYESQGVIDERSIIFDFNAIEN